MKKSNIYTRTGDKGMTSLVGGMRVPKNHTRIEAYGTIDELNADIGLLLSLLTDADDAKTLQFIQHQLFAVGAYLATAPSASVPTPACYLEIGHLSRLEEEIDRIDVDLPPLKGFILPGGSYPAAICHVCRTVCRRTERRILTLEATEGCEIDKKIKQFINRLSDYLFVLARKLNYFAQTNEIYWDKSCR